MITQYGENANRYSVSPSIGKYKDKQPKTYCTPNRTGEKTIILLKSIKKIV